MSADAAFFLDRIAGALAGTLELDCWAFLLAPRVTLAAELAVRFVLAVDSEAFGSDLAPLDEEDEA